MKNLSYLFIPQLCNKVTLAYEISKFYNLILFTIITLFKKAFLKVDTMDEY